LHDVGKSRPQDETSGMSFSPGACGLLFQVWRKDGFPFHATCLDVKHHQATTGRQSEHHTPVNGDTTFEAIDRRNYQLSRSSFVDLV
jgi:hypothetical protein